MTPTSSHPIPTLRPTSRRGRAAVAGAALLVVLAVVLGGLSGSSSAAPVSFNAGSLIIPMDTDTSSIAHTAANQDSGMWKAYGLVYKLLQNDIPVKWAVVDGKSLTTDIDVSVSNVKDKRTNAALGAWAYRGGPFIIDSSHAAAASPIITAWWAANSNFPNVHVAQAGFSADVRLNLTRAPRIANEAINAGITMAYYNAAGIPDSNGNPWTAASSPRARPARSASSTRS